MKRATFGLLPVLKHPGLTSHDVVGRARRLLGIRRIGHAGTLDPGVAGVLVLLVGRATRLAELLQAESKEYIAEMCIGTSTDTQDGFGRVLTTNRDCSLSRTELDDVLADFVGASQQVPPMTAAVRRQGRRLYELAREGIEVERPPRDIFIDALQLVRTIPEKGPLPFGSRVTFRVSCSKGTYVRTLCHDIGSRLKCGAYMSFLLRTRAGDIDLSMTRTLDELEREKESTGNIRLLSPDVALGYMTARRLSAEGAGHIVHGRPVGDEHFVDGPVVRSAQAKQDATPRPGMHLLRLYSEDGRFLALAANDGETAGRWRPRIVFSNERGDVRD